MRAPPGRMRLAGAVTIGAALLVIVLILPSRPLDAPPPGWRPSGATARGVFHVHTRRSDGTGAVEEVAGAASRAGLQFVILTDHGDATRVPDAPAYRSGVLCIDAVEISTFGGHYAALGLGPAPYPLGGEPRDVADDVRRMGGFGIVTHPNSTKPGLTWRAWDVSFDAIEWLNGDSLWRDAGLARLARAGLTYPFRPVETLAALYERPATLSTWDALTRARDVVGLAGTDAHARIGFRDRVEPYERRVIARLPAYETAFRVASIRAVLPGPLSRRAPEDAAAVIAAIRAGHVYTVVDGRAAPAAFEFAARSGGVSARSGDHLPLADAAIVEARANVPDGGSIALFRDGSLVHRTAARELVFASDRRGVYRAEVWLPSRSGGTSVPWIVGNPIYIGSRPERAAGPPSVPVAAGRALRPFDPTDWVAEHDPRSSGSIERNGSGVGLRYRLAGGERAGQFAALGATAELRGDVDGVVFQGSADRPMRICVQVRSWTGPDHVRWRRSVYLDPSEREVLVRLDDMTPAEPTPTPAPPRDRVKSLLFVVDTVNTAPGTAGVFRLRDLRVLSSPLVAR